MKAQRLRPTSLLAGLAAMLACSTALVARAAAPPVPDPCTLVTVAEMRQIVGPLTGTPRATGPASGEISCTYEPEQGPSYIDIRLHDGELGAWKARTGGKSPVSLPELGKDSFVNPDADGYTELFASKGALILNVSLPAGPTSVAMARAIAEKALKRL